MCCLYVCLSCSSLSVVCCCMLFVDVCLPVLCSVSCLFVISCVVVRCLLVRVLVVLIRSLLLSYDG